MTNGTATVENLLRVAVIQPPLVLGRDFIDYPWFANLGAVHSAGAVRAAGHDVTLLDAFSTYGANLYPYDGEARLWGVPVPRLLKPLLRDPVDVAVIHDAPFLHLEAPNPELARLVSALRDHNPRARIVLDDGYLGAMHYLDHDRAAVLERHGLDYACQYESGLTLPALLRAIEDGTAPLPTAAARDRVYRQREEPPLDSLADPAWDLVDAGNYGSFLKGIFDRSRRVNPFRVALDSRPLVTSRGCVYRCVFCSTNPHAGPDGAHRFRRHGGDVLRRQLRALREAQGAHHLAILDQAANLNPEFGDVLAALEELDFQYDFPNGVRADLLREEHLDAMKGRVGTLSISAESGDQRVVDEVVRKRLDLSHVERVAREAAARDIQTVVHFMVGLPGETRREVLATFDLALRLFERWGAEPLVSFATPMPGTELWRMAQSLELEDRTAATPVSDRVQHQATLGTGRGGIGPDELTAALVAFRRRVRSHQSRKVVVNLTYRCNNHCEFCAVGNPPAPTKGSREGGADHRAGTIGFRPRVAEDATVGTVERALERYAREGVRLVDFDGGEPLLHPRVVHLIRHARRLGYERVTLTTNGRLLSYEDVACELLASGLHALRVSLHGPDAETHEAATRGPGSFLQTVDGLRNVLRLMPRGWDLGVNTTVTADNLAGLGDLAALLAELGVARWSVQLVTPFGAAGGGVSARLAPDEGRLRSELGPLLERWGDTLDISVVNAPPCLLPGHERRVVGDLAKSARTMVFVTDEHVNLADYLALRRSHGPECAECLHRPVCAGPYRFAEEG